MKKYSIYLWSIVALIFLSFIGVMSYWYPVTLDEYFRWGVPFRWDMIRDAYLYIVPRISVLFTIPIFALGKWFFIMANSLIQLANCLLIFYIIFVRFPNIKDLKDMPLFLTIMLMSVFFVCKPSEVMFWISGAVNYSWSIMFFLIMLCYLRQIQTKKIILKDNWLLRIILFILGFIVGMTNECLAPVAFGSTLFFALFCEYKKVKTSRGLSFLIFGLTIGCAVFFISPAHYSKMTFEFVSNVSAVSLSQKLFFHINHLNEFFQAQFFLFVITALLLILAFVDRDKKDIKKDDLWLSLFILFCSFAMAFILFIVPQPPLRAYYPASVVCLISFLLIVKYYIYAYEFDFSKWLCYFVLAVCLFLTPRFVLPHYSLQVQTDIHKYLQSFSKKTNIPYIVLKGPTDNLSIGFTDPARRIRVGGEMWTADASPLINW